jgi:hypothetical protein
VEGVEQMSPVALCINSLAGGAYRHQDEADKLFGAGWVPMFVKLAEEAGMPVYSGPEALDQIKRGNHQASDFLVVQEESNSIGMDLISRGAQAQVLFCLESPLYAPRFYDVLPKLKELFRSEVLFTGGTHNIYFPSFHPHEILPVTSWGHRKLLCMVSANKHYSGIREGIYSANYKQALDHQLQDLRYQAIEALSATSQFDLFGHGWPLHIGKPCADKIETMSHYKFSLVIENVKNWGYLTEKMIQCFVAGTIPIYFGAPDAPSLVPKEAFIDLVKWGKIYWAELVRHIDSISPDQGVEMIEAGRQFLASELGQRHNHLNFAVEMLKRVRGEQ